MHLKMQHNNGKQNLQKFVLIFQSIITLPTFFYLLPIPLTTAGVFLLLWKDLHSSNESRPFFLSISLFVLGYLGLGISLYPWIVPFKFTIWEAASAPTSQSLLLIGIIIFLPIILAYTAYNYYVFRGKSSHESMY